jgi:hypothetical protein
VFKPGMLLGLLFVTGAAHAAPVVTLGTSDDYCVVFCYIRIPFTITHYEATRNVGMLYCDVDAEATSALAANNGELRTRSMHESPIGVFKNTAGEIKGAVEIDTGIRKNNFKGSRVKTASCHIP